MKAFVGALFALSFSLAAQNSQPPSRAILTEPFDTPTASNVKDLGPSPYNMPGRQSIRIRLSCYSFPTFMVKEYDEGQKGAEWVAVAPIATKTVPSCGRSHIQGEKIIADGWCGYFKGVKKNLVFLDACDGTNGGLPFAVYDSTTGKKVFEDSAYDSRMWSKEAKNAAFDRLKVIGVQGKPLLLRYLRVVEADCDLHAEKAACWERVRSKLRVNDSQMPGCSGYEGISGSANSVIAYPVEVHLSAPPVITTVRGPVKCWAPN